VSGVPVQNNLSELLNLVSFMGTADLAKYKHLNFMIEKSSMDASLMPGLRLAISKKCMREIRSYLGKYMLRRTYVQV